MNVDNKLLVINNAPIKVYLDGFGVLDFLRTAKLIQTHGGRVSPPSDSTLILSSPDHQPGTKFVQFDIKWLYDSVNQKKRQDIGKYLLPPVIIVDDFDGMAPGQRSPDVQSVQSAQSVEIVECEVDECENAEIINGSKSIDEEKAHSANDRNDVPREKESETESETGPETELQTEPETGTEKEDDSECISVASASENDEPPSLFPVNKARQQRTTPIRIKDLPELIINDVTDREDSDVIADKKKKNKSEEVNESEEMSFSDVNTESDASVNGCWRFAPKRTENEKIPRLNGKFWDTTSILTPESIPTQSPTESQDRDVQKNVAQGQGQGTEAEVVESMEEANPGQGESLRNVRYSFEDDQKIVQYLIDKDAIPRVQGPSVWFNMAYDKILPNRDASSLRFRFETKLINEISHYTDDPLALEQFNVSTGVQNVIEYDTE